MRDDKDELAQREREKVLAWGVQRKANVRLCGPHQLKVGDLNFYPTTGAIVRDGSERDERRGADAFIEMLEARFASHRGQKIHLKIG